MSSQTRFEIRAAVRGIKEIDQLKRSIKQLKTNTKPAALVIAQLQTEARKLGSQSDVTENELRTSINVFKELRANVALTGAQYKDLTADIQKAEAALAKAAITSKKSNFSFKSAAKGLGAVAGAGVFGGPEGAIGATIGLLMPGGGAAAALAGGAIGAQVGMARKAIGETAEYAASLGLQRKALSLVIANTDEYAKAQEFLSRKSKKLAIPQDVIVRQFTALTASVKGAGQSTEDAQKVFESIASGIRGTGGSLEDMKAAMTATAQVFSKGKVSAEELRQQLGERLPGAFTIFAESMDKTPAELDKALEGGKVTLDDFMKFADVLFKKYGKNAEILAKGPEAAGDRFATAMSEFKDVIGSTLIPIGAAFQNSIAEMVTQIGESEVALMILEGTLKTVGATAFATFASVRFLTRAFVDLIRILHETSSLNFGKALDIAKKGLEDTAKQAKKDWEALASIVNGENSVTSAINKTEKATEDLGSTSLDVFANMKAGVTAYKNSILDVSKQIENATKAAFTKMEDALVNFVMTGKMNFKEFARSVIADITRIFIRSQILGMFDFLGNKWGGSLAADRKFSGLGPGSALNTTGALPKGANGLVVAESGIVPFARGGIVNKPTYFPFSKGVGLMGEAGPESIMPLKRGSDGKLGVIAHGGGTSVVVNVDASGSDVQGDEGNAAALGRAISAAVTEEIAKQKRPGGLLSAA